MSERRDFPKWKVELAYIAQDGVCARCGRPLDRGFHRHHKDGNPMNNSLENLELLCPECHYATFGHEGEKNPLEEHRNLERKILERLDDLIGKALDGQVSGAVMERLLEAMTMQLKLSRRINKLDEDLEKPPAIIIAQRRMIERGLLEEAYMEGFKAGVEMMKNFICPKKMAGKKEDDFEIDLDEGVVKAKIEMDELGSELMKRRGDEDG